MLANTICWSYPLTGESPSLTGVWRLRFWTSFEYVGVQETLFHLFSPMTVSGFDRIYFTKSWRKKSLLSFCLLFTYARFHAESFFVGVSYVSISLMLTFWEWFNGTLPSLFSSSLFIAINPGTEMGVSVFQIYFWRFTLRSRFTTFAGVLWLTRNNNRAKLNIQKFRFACMLVNRVPCCIRSITVLIHEYMT